MQKFLVTVFLLGSIYGANAQQNKFVYIQSDDKQPFTVSLDNKEYKASSIGYVIIPKLRDGEYSFSISFPEKAIQDQRFNLSVTSDAGYALKNFGEKGWGLFNLNTLDITMAANGSPTKEAPTVKNNTFGDMLSGAVGDESIKDIAVAKEKPKVTTPAPAVSAESPTTIGTASSEMKNSESVPGIELLNRNRTENAVEMVFIDPLGAKSDTISIYLTGAMPETADLPANAQQEKISEASTDASAEIQKQETDKSITGVDNPFYNSDQKPATESPSKEASSQANTANKNENAFREECENMFTQSDLEKLRKKMIGASSDERMTEIAEKAIGKKCIISKQVRLLGPLYLSDDSRLKFFTAMYPYVYDVAAFAGLENQLIDPEYKEKFRQMAKQ